MTGNYQERLFMKTESSTYFALSLAFAGLLPGASPCLAQGRLGVSQRIPYPASPAPQAAAQKAGTVPATATQCTFTSIRQSEPHAYRHHQCKDRGRRSRGFRRDEHLPRLAGRAGAGRDLLDHGHGYSGGFGKAQRQDRVDRHRAGEPSVDRTHGQRQIAGKS